MSPKKQARKAARNGAANKKRSRGFADEERTAMKERACELTVEARRGSQISASGKSKERAPTCHDSPYWHSMENRLPHDGSIPKM